MENLSYHNLLVHRELIAEIQVNIKNLIQIANDECLTRYDSIHYLKKEQFIMEILVTSFNKLEESMPQLHLTYQSVRVLMAKKLKKLRPYMNKSREGILVSNAVPSVPIIKLFTEYDTSIAVP